MDAIRAQLAELLPSSFSLADRHLAFIEPLIAGAGDTSVAYAGACTAWCDSPVVDDASTPVAGPADQAVQGILVVTNSLVLIAGHASQPHNGDRYALRRLDDFRGYRIESHAPSRPSARPKVEVHLEFRSDGVLRVAVAEGQADAIVRALAGLGDGQLWSDWMFDGDDGDYSRGR